MCNDVIDRDCLRFGCALVWFRVNCFGMIDRFFKIDRERGFVLWEIYFGLLIVYIYIDTRSRILIA